MGPPSKPRGHVQHMCVGARKPSYAPRSSPEAAPKPAKIQQRSVSFLTCHWLQWNYLVRDTSQGARPVTHAFLPGKLSKFWKPTPYIAAPTAADPDPACAGSSSEAELREAHEEEQASSKLRSSRGTHNSV